MEKVTVERLLSIEALHDVPAGQLQWFIDNSRHYILEDGEQLFQPGKPITGTHIVLEGKIDIYAIQNGSKREITIVEPGGITGYLPFSRGKTAGGTGQSIGKTQLMTFPAERMQELILNHYELTQALVHVMTTRVREFTALQQQNEKMMALGKLSAGLAHELNNPAAAIVRGSASLKKHLQLLPQTFKQVIAIRMDDEQVDAVNNRMFDKLGQTGRPVLTLMQQNTREDGLMDWLDEHQVENSPEIAENFVEFGFEADDLDYFADHVPQQYLSPVFNWINNNLITEKMVNDIMESSQRISRLVNSVKNFTHMDKSQDKQLTDIHSGIRNTLTMLNHKLNKGNIELKENYDLTLPQVSALVGELNQVWTNLIDNALDAMEVNTKGELEIKTQRDNEFVKVSISDNGPGIPEDIRQKIFDPFFTTKEIGKGTGLGLDVVMRIVKQHRGSVKANSTPGRTEFIVCFPING